MPRNPARPDLIGRLRRNSEEMRQQRIHPRGHTESKTFIVGGNISPVIYIPPFIVGINSDAETPEWKRLTGFAAILQAGSATIDWLVNGSPVTATLAATTTIDTADLPTPLLLAHGDTIQPVISAATGATALSAVAFIVTGT